MRQLKISTQITNRDSQAVEKYLQEISKIPLISIEEETELAIIIKAKHTRNPKKSDERNSAQKKHLEERAAKALDKLVQANLRFVVSVAKQYQHQGLALSDLINEGNLGLTKAAQRFDETRGFKFISYAVRWIRQSILQALAEQGRIVRLPQNKIGTYNKANKASIHFEQEHEREPSTEELAELLDMHEEEIANILTANTRHSSLDAPLVSDGEDTHLDRLASNSDDNSEATEISEAIATAMRLVKQLSEKEKLIVLTSFGFDTGYSLEELGDRYDLTKERVRQIKENAIKKLQKNNAFKNMLIGREDLNGTSKTVFYISRKPIPQESQSTGNTSRADLFDKKERESKQFHKDVSLYHNFNNPELYLAEKMILLYKLNRMGYEDVSAKATSEEKAFLLNYKDMNSQELMLVIHDLENKKEKQFNKAIPDVQAETAAALNNNFDAEEEKNHKRRGKRTGTFYETTPTTINDSGSHHSSKNNTSEGETEIVNQPTTDTSVVTNEPEVTPDKAITLPTVPDSIGGDLITTISEPNTMITDTIVKDESVSLKETIVGTPNFVAPSRETPDEVAKHQLLELINARHTLQSVLSDTQHFTESMKSFLNTLFSYLLVIYNTNQKDRYGNSYEELLRMAIRGINIGIGVTQCKAVIDLVKKLYTEKST